MNETISQKITKLNNDRTACITNLLQKGVDADNTDGFSQIASKILEIPSDKLTSVYVDNEVAYRKQVPSGSAGVCYLNSIGGMTYKGFTFDCVVEERGGLFFAPYSFTFPKEFTLPEYGDGSMWTFAPIVVGFPNDLFYDLLGTDCTLSGRNMSGIGYGVTDVPVGTQLRCVPRFVDYMAAEPRYYYPPDCFTDLRDAKPTAVVSYGANLIPFPYMGNKDVGHTAATAGITYTVNEDRSITINGTTTTGASFNVENFVGGLPSGNYVLKLHYINGAHREGVYISSNVGHTRDNTEITIGPSKKLTWFSINVEANKTIDNFRVQIMLNLGTTALPYSPYRAPITYDLPTGITQYLGKGCSDTIFDEYSFVDGKAITRVGEGAVTDIRYESVNSKRATFWVVGFTGMRTDSNGDYVAYGRLPFFDIAYSIKQINADGYLQYVGTLYGTNMYIYVPALFGFTNADAFISWMQNQNFKYVVELENYTEEPITIDPDDPNYFDGLIEVEAGGYLEFVNEYGYPVPSTVTFSTINGGGTT